MTKNSWIIIGAVIVALLIGFAIWQRPSIAPQPSSTASSTYTVGNASTSPSSTTAAPQGSVTTGNVQAEYTLLGKWDAATAPNYKQPIAFNADLSADVKAQINASLAKAQAQIAANPHTFAAWINLGALHKMGGDYSFAESAWIYMSKVFPTSETPFFNLASLYDYQLKDYPKAEANYLVAVKNNPHDTSVYHDLSVMYANKYKTDTNLAESILKQGIASNPGAYDLQVSLAEYYVQKGRIADAKAEYQAAMANAKAQGYTQVAASIQTDLDRLQ